MPLAAGCQHIALVTADIDRFTDFYARIFDAEVRMDLTEGPMRHLMVDLGGVWLHPFQLPGDRPEAAGGETAFRRGHLDHFAVEMPDRKTFEEVRRRAVEAGASDGAIVDFGMLIQVTLRDPDGMELEISLPADGAPLKFEDRRTLPWPSRG